MKKFPFFRQTHISDCGPACLKMVARHYGRDFSFEMLRDFCYVGKQGISVTGLVEGGKSIGLDALPVKLAYYPENEATAGLLNAPLPFIAHWNQNHFVVVHHITEKHVWIADPAEERLKLTREEFEKGWLGASGQSKGVAILFEPQEKFYTLEDTYRSSGAGNWKMFLQYLKPFRGFAFPVFLAIGITTLLQFIFPFITKAVVDYGIDSKDIEFVYLLLIGQIAFFVFQNAVQAIRSFTFLHISGRMNISLVSDFLRKVLKLPLSYLDSILQGDIFQRMMDHDRIQRFLSFETLDFLVSLITFVLFSFILAGFSPTIFIVFVFLTIVFVMWTVYFLRYRKKADYLFFRLHSRNQSKVMEILYGMQEIKLQNAMQPKIGQWEELQANLYKGRINLEKIGMIQSMGAGFLNELKNIIILFLCSKLVIDGEMTLGTMLSVQYITAQLNMPVMQFVHLLQEAQDAKLSFDRIVEIRNKEDEGSLDKDKATVLPANRDISFRHLSFRYNPISPYVLKELNFTIPYGKTTAIVGHSGSGKTTLIKLLLKFYEKYEGELRVGPVPLNGVQSYFWRDQCGAVLQDGFIFSDTIAKNIAVSDDEPDPQKLALALNLSNAAEFVNELPQQVLTMIGSEGVGLSMGQKQRILIARAIYKNPQFIFFDEATNNLDSENEQTIVNNLARYFAGKTVVVVAHRLSTVQHADQIIVLNRGRIEETGNHQSLTEKRGFYYQLIKNQLELGK